MSKLAWSKLKIERNAILKNTDYTQLADAPFTSKEKKYYREYRQFLRDITKNFDNKSILKAKIPTFDEWLEKAREGKYK